MATLIATYRSEQLKGHFGRALNNGVTKDETAEIITDCVLFRLAFFGDGAPYAPKFMESADWRERGVWL